MKIKLFHYWYLIVIPILLFFAGAASNQVVLIANGGKFPVMLNERQIKHFQQADEDDQKYTKQFTILDTAVRSGAMSEDGQFLDDVHSIMGHNSNLKFLADYINLRTAIYSPGDLALELGIWLWQFTPIMWLALVFREVVYDTTVNPVSNVANSLSRVGSASRSFWPKSDKSKRRP